MPFRRDGRTWIAASWVCLAWLACVSTASADESASDRHFPSRSAARKPAGVPANYVFTHHGFFHPSCVVSVRSDEKLGADLVVRGTDGSEHARFSPCAYPRYGFDGLSVPSAGGSSGRASPSALSRLSAHRPHAATYDGWIVSYGYEGRIASGSNLSTQWVVPLPPANVGDQDIAFFNDIETTADGEDVLQPVLDFGEIRGHWAIESEHCCISGNDEQSTLVQVSPGDTILGVVTSTGCDTTGACESWTVTTRNVTTGGSTVLNTASPMGVPNTVNSGVLEAYGVMSCDMFPASGEETFIDNALTQANGGVETLTYGLDELSSSPASLPACAYGGSTSGNSYTLIFSASPMAPTDAGAPLDSGAPDDAPVDGTITGPSDASLDGAADVKASDDAFTVGATDAMGVSEASEPDSAKGAGTGVVAVADSGGDFDANNDGGGKLGSSSDAGLERAQGPSCGCILAGAGGSTTSGPLALLVVAGAWRRRKARNASTERPSGGILS